jgi:hypothetical protein
LQAKANIARGHGGSCEFQVELGCACARGCRLYRPALRAASIRLISSSMIGLAEKGLKVAGAQKVI